MTGLRFGFSFAAAVTLTSGVFWLLQTLIDTKVDAADLRPAARIEFTRLRRDSDVQSRREVKPKLELAPAAPTAPMVAAAGVGGGTGSPAPRLAATPGRILGTGALLDIQKVAVRGGGSDRDVIPLVRIEPEYPPRALDRTIEGWVLVRFTITTIGTVKDPVVVDAAPKNVFEEAALRAVRQWKYNPKIEDGVAVERRGVQTLLRFALDKEKR